ncbi:MAG: tRNA(Met) cytidine acetyltransferase [Thermoprotei archaeon]|nr:MAG: tRNA(Met) cytidine acetyltransferase [Thermoprotei archaeon]
MVAEMPRDVAIKILTSLKKARIAHHRRLIVLTGDNDEKLVGIATSIIETFVRHFRPESLSILYAFHRVFDDSLDRRRCFKERLEKIKGLEIDFVPYPDTAKVLGLTYDIAVLDLVNDLKPNDLGRLIGIIRGGGFIVLLMPAFRTFMRKTTRFQENLITIGYTPKDLRHIFKKRFLRKLLQHKGVIIYDVDSDRIIKEDGIQTVKPFSRTKPTIPPQTIFPKKAYSLALTEDQARVVKMLEALYEKPEDRKLAIVITADRGRGKSCAVGIGIASLAYRLRRAKGRTRIIITAPSITNVQPLFNLAAKTLKELGQDVDIEKDREGFLVSVKARGIELEYYAPLEALRRSGDIIAVDEAAGLQVPMLFGIHRRFSRMIFSSTIHGYEGAGRGFSVRFLQLLRRDPKTAVYEYEMEEPIRYASDDPVENWLFDTLLLDAEPADLDEKDLEDVKLLRTKYVIPKLEGFFLHSEDKLRQFVGIYIMAHYRNNPDDVGMMMDAPHHEVRFLETSSGKVVTSVELAIEGGIPIEIGKNLANGEWVAGNIIPDRYIKHYRVLEFGLLKGWRIVRIATHPQVQGRGLGSKVLDFICEEAKKRGYDWVGAGFGVNYELLRFWIKNGFMPIHISPERNPISGEYTVIVVKPLTRRAQKFIKFANKEFRIKLLNSLNEPYHDLNPRVALLLLKDWGLEIKEISLNLTDVQKARLMSYSWDLMTIENCFDAVQMITKYYFSRKADKRPSLEETDEEVLIVKVLQAKSWRVACEQLKMNPPVLMSKVREIIRRLCEYYLDASEQKLKSYFIHVK